MKTILYIMTFICVFVAASCVQKSYKRVVVVTLDVSKMKDIQSVGLPRQWKPFKLGSRLSDARSCKRQFV